MSSRGSSETADWVTNLMCDPTGNDKGECKWHDETVEKRRHTRATLRRLSVAGTHEGMRRAAINIDSEIRQEMLDYLKDHRHYNVYLTVRTDS